MGRDFGSKIWIPATVLFLAAHAAAQATAPQRLEIRVLAGPSTTLVKGSSTYADVWSLGLLTKIDEQNLFFLKSDNGFSLAAFLSYYLRPGLGFEAGLGFFKSEVVDTTTFRSQYLWASGKYDTLDKTWTGTGSLRVIPLCLNGVKRWRTGKIESSISAGPTLFWNAFQAAGWAGFSVSEIAYVQTFNPPETTTIQSVDALPVDVAIEKYSWSALGANIGAAVVYKLSAKVGLTAGFRYYLCPKKEFAWSWLPGTYDGVNQTITGWEFTSDNARFAESRTGPSLKINPSILQFGLGIQLFL